MSDFYPIPKLPRVIQSYDIPAPVIFCSTSDPIHAGQGLDPVSAMDFDPWIASPSEIAVDERIAHLTAAEHAGGTLDGPITVVSMTSDSSTSSKVCAPELVKDVVVTKGENESPHSTCCDVCNVICNSQKTFKKHLEGKIHLKNTQKLPATSLVKQEMPLPVANIILDQDIDNKNEVMLQNGIPVDLLFYCSIPELSCANQDSQNIVTEQVREAMCLDEIKPSNGVTHKGHEKLSVHQPMWCDVCKVNCSSGTCFERHIAGRQHLKNVKLSKKNVAAVLPSTAIKPEVVNPFESNSTRCELCGISCRSNHELNNHISGKKHQKKLKKCGNVNGNSPATAPLQDPMIEEGEIVEEESSKRKANISLSSDDDEKKKQRTMEEDVGSGGLLTCRACNVVCKGIMGFNSHLASSEHSDMVMKQVDEVSNKYEA